MTTPMSRHELSNDILLMTTALEGLQIGTPSSAPITSNAHDILQAFATLLSIITLHDSSASNVLGVTGTMDSDSIKAFVVTRDAGTKPFDVFSKPAPAERAQDQVVMQNLANIYESRNPELIVHVLDNIAFLELLRSTLHRQKSFDVASALFIRFAHHRAFEKINDRIKLRSKLWDEDPFALLATQSPTPIDPVIVSFESPTPLLTEALSSHSLLPDERRQYTVNTDNVHEWVLVLHDLHQKLQTLIANGTETSGKRQALKAESYKPFVAIIYALFRLLQCKPLVRAIEGAYRNADEFLVSHRTTTRNTHERESFEEELQDLLSDNTITDHEVVHALHYYRTFTSWMHASFKLISFLRRTSAPSLELEFHLVSALEDTVVPLPTKDDVLSFSTRYPDIPRHHFEPIVTGRMETLVGKIHCEAQLMTLIDLQASGLAHELPTNIPPSPHQVPIGVIEKCCYSCTLLADHLTKRVSFVLPGTHGIVHPWIPPPSLDMDVMRKLRDVLEIQMHKHFASPDPTSDFDVIVQLEPVDETMWL